MMISPGKVVTVLFAIMAIGSGVALHHMTADQPVAHLSSQTGTTTHDLSGATGLSQPSKLTPAKSVPATASSPNVSVQTSSNCTKTVNTSNQPTATGQTEASQTAVHCSSQAQNSSTSVSVTSQSQQSASSGANTSGQSGLASNSDSVNVNVGP